MEERLIRMLEDKLHKERKNFKDFVTEYCDGKSYMTIKNQLNGYSKIQDYLIDAIKKYLEG